ncbi:SDR family NAD(P)-dependent oxidoreductase [Rhodococcus sp. NBC_00294]|uniref:SDR family NAD(P)-dependent oxidoreductase n=1 Tax=Rhodococcus sp. NBC_00294 TaxID=2976004 RepID=UPI002E293349|nr:SDR family NAD(P)-dependent oxidoreductase [Rhodococcus sp. NBC_00294]
MTTALITGANKGLGLETARRLVDSGVDVYAGVRDPGRADDVRALGAHVVRLDVTDTDSVTAAVSSLPRLAS